MYSKPFFSIIIVNYNHGKFLEGAIKSVLGQGCKDFELIVVDGASTDNSVEIIRRYEEHIKWWVSEPDRGQSDAFNKGFSHASGRFGCWLNADDIMMPEALNTVKDYVDRHKKVEWVGGSSVFCDDEMRVVWCSRCARIISSLYQYLPTTCVNGPSSYFLIENLNKSGGFDTELHYLMDIDLWKKFFSAGYKLHHVSSYLWSFRLHEGSKTSHRMLEKTTKPELYKERVLVNTRSGSSANKQKIGGVLFRLYKLCCGAYLKAFFDTKRFKGKHIYDVFHVNSGGQGRDAPV